MAVTTKTLSPTNQVVSLPDMTERPNASVLVDGIGKDADAINALSDHIGKLIQARNASCSIASIAANGTVDIECTLSSAFTNSPVSYVFVNTGSTNLIPVGVRTVVDSTHINVRIYNCATASSNINYTFRVLGISAALNV